MMGVTQPMNKTERAEGVTRQKRVLRWGWIGGSVGEATWEWSVAAAKEGGGGGSRLRR